MSYALRLGKHHTTWQCKLSLSQTRQIWVLAPSCTRCTMNLGEFLRSAGLGFPMCKMVRISPSRGYCKGWKRFFLAWEHTTRKDKARFYSQDCLPPVCVPLALCWITFSLGITLQLFFFFFSYIFIRLCQVLAATHGIFTAMCRLLSSCVSKAPECVGSVPEALGLFSPDVESQFPDQGSNLHPLHWKADS